MVTSQMYMVTVSDLNFAKPLLDAVLDSSNISFEQYKFRGHFNVSSLSPLFFKVGDGKSINFTRMIEK